MKSEQINPEHANRLVLYYLLISIAIGLAGSFINHLVNATNTDIPYLISLIVLSCFIFWLAGISRQHTPASLGFRGFSWTSTLSLYCWLIIVGEGITAFVLAWFPEPMVEVLLKAFTPETRLSWFLFITMATVLAPIGEEIVFRGFILNSYASCVGTSRAIWLSAILFGLAHHSPPHVLAAFFSGLVFARYLMAGGSLWSTMAAHAMVNFTSTLMMHFNHSPLAFPQHEASAMGGILGLGIAIIATALFFHHHPVISQQKPERVQHTVISISLIIYLLITLSLATLSVFSTLSQSPVAIPAH